LARERDKWIVSQGVVYDDAWRGLPVSVVYDS
jgi:hypothetical protein